MDDRYSRLVDPGSIVQILGELEPHHDDESEVTFSRVAAQFARDFTGIDAVRYHESVRIQAPFCPLNVKRVQDAPLENAVVKDDAAIDDSVLEELFDDDDEFEDLVHDLSDQARASQQQDPDGSKDLFEDSDL